MSDFLQALKEVEQESKTSWPWRSCRVCFVLTELDDEDAAGLRLVLANKRITNHSINELIYQQLGYDVDVTRHRQGKCKGPRE